MTDFHPTMVRFKGDARFLGLEIQYNFHPTMVRFKETPLPGQPVGRGPDFHPTMVRFKAG